MLLLRIFLSICITILGVMVVSDIAIQDEHGENSLLRPSLFTIIFKIVCCALLGGTLFLTFKI